MAAEVTKNTNRKHGEYLIRNVQLLQCSLVMWNKLQYFRFSWANPLSLNTASHSTLTRTGTITSFVFLKPVRDSHKHFEAPHSLGSARNRRSAWGKLPVPFLLGVAPHRAVLMRRNGSFQLSSFSCHRAGLFRTAVGEVWLGDLLFLFCFPSSRAISQAWLAEAQHAA